MCRGLTSAAAPSPTPPPKSRPGEAQQLAITEYRDWLRQIFLKVAAGTGVADSQALADALTILLNGALATTEKDSGAHAAAMTAIRIARLTLAAARSSSSA